MTSLTRERHVIESIIQRAFVCRIGLSDRGQPYVVPVCFGYADGVIYFHSSQTGRKLDILRRNDAVCVEFDIDCDLVERERACRWSMMYRSVIGFGRASFVEGVEGKRRALDVIMAHYGGAPDDYDRETLRKMAVVRIELQDVTAKVAGY